MRITEVEWLEIAKVGYPSIEEFGAYPCVFIAMKCKGQFAWGYSVRIGELRFFGGDKTRPYWVSPMKSDGHVPLENDSWHVTHWAPMIQGPK